MKIEKCNYINFTQAKLPTDIIVQAALGRQFTENAYSGFRDICRQLYSPPIMIPGQIGFAKHAFVAGKHITQKYKNVAEATEEILNLYENNPKIKSVEVRDYFQKNIISKLGKEMDVDIELKKLNFRDVTKFLEK